MSTELDPVTFDSMGSPIYAWAIGDCIPDDTKVALAEVRARLEQNAE